MSPKASWYFPIALVCLLVLPSAAVGQGTGGGMLGKVKDASGAPVEVATVNIKDNGTQRARNAFTDSQGRYEVPELQPGDYQVTVSKGGFITARVSHVHISVAQETRLGDITLKSEVVTPPQPGTVRAVPEEVEVEVYMTDLSSPTLSTSFTDRQIRELPVVTRDINTLALLAPGVFSVRTFSFASTLVPFAANGSRGRDNNFIIDSVDNNEPLFGGAAAQFTNTDLFADYRILTNQYKAEYGRNSGSVVNIITERGGNEWHGTIFFFGQSDRFNAETRAESTAELSGTTRNYETQAGATLGGPLKKGSAWAFLSYQWDRVRDDLSPVFPVIATLPTVAGFSALSGLPSTPTLAALLSVPTVKIVPAETAPCGTASSNLPANNPCTVGSVTVTTASGSTSIPFGTFLVPRGGLFDIRDHQLSGRYDQKVSVRDDIYFRYLFDDLRTPVTTGGTPLDVGLTDFGVLPDWGQSIRQRTQNLGLFWTRAWATALHELRGSFTRISSSTGAFGVSEAVREHQPAVTIFDSFALSPGTGGTSGATPNFLAAFPAAGRTLTLGPETDTRPTNINSNLFQLQDNFSWTRGRNSFKVGANFVRTQSNIRQIPLDLGEYFYFSFSNFVNNTPDFAGQRLPNSLGRGGDVLPVREFAQFYFFQDDIRARSNLTFSLGLRYENYGQAINKVAELNSGFGPKLDRDDHNFAPRVGFAWSPRSSNWVLRGGYGIFYNPTVFNIALITWQGGQVAPLRFNPSPQNRFPLPPFNPFPSGFVDTLAGTSCDAAVTSATQCTTADTVAHDLVNPLVQNYSLSVQRQVGRNLLVEISYVGSYGRSLFQRRDVNPRTGWDLTSTLDCTSFPNGTGFFPCLKPRLNPARGDIREVTNGAKSNYNALQVSATHRLSRGPINTAISAAYTFSHMIDNASEIFGPGVSASPFLGGPFSGGTVEAITPFPQDPTCPVSCERGNSSFDRRHRAAISFLALFPKLSPGPARWFFGNWQFNGLFTAQSGQPFSPLNGFRTCVDANGDGLFTNDRPFAGSGPGGTAAVLVNCADPSQGYVRPGTTSPVFSQSDALKNSQFVQAPLNGLKNPNNTASGLTLAGRDILRGPKVINLDFAVFKNFPWGERGNLQFRVEAYNLFNRTNPGNPLGNVFVANAQPAPAIAFAPSFPTPARLTGGIPENTIDAQDRVTGKNAFLSQQFLNTAPRRLQFGIRLVF